MPSPHVEVHVVGEAMLQVQPLSRVQVALQPSPAFTLPSSQTSAGGAARIGRRSAAA
jgi:hypothetical protein